MPNTQEPNPSDTRVARARRRVARLRNVAVAVVALAVAGALLVAAGLWLLGRTDARASRGLDQASGLRSEAAAAASASIATARMTEVPDLRGSRIDEATAVLKSAGFAVRVRFEGAAAAPSQRLVVSQQPTPRALAAPGQTVTIIVPPKRSAPGATGSKAQGAGGASSVVVLDPGHQSHSDARLEPVGPGSGSLKPSMTAGGAGVCTNIAEYELVLEIANNVRARLVAAGVRVVMTRTTSDVDLSNAARAAIANQAHANLFVRIHADGDPDAGITGISALYPAPNQWTTPIADSSKRAAVLVQSDAVAATGAVNRGAMQRADIAGFNWAKVPSVLVEAGCPSNEVEDRLLASPNYQDKLSAGISEGILGYLKGQK